MKNQKGTPRFFRTLNRKFILGFSVLAFAILIASCTIGYHVYKTNIEKVFNEHAYSVAIEARSLIDGDFLKHYAETLTEDEDYYKMKADVENLRKNMNVISIFVTQVNTPSQGDYLYLIDTFEEHDYEFPLGGVNPYPVEYKSQVETVYYDGTDLSDTCIYVDSDTYGSNFFAIVPIYDSNGDIVADLFVQSSIEQMHGTLRQYLMYAISFTIILVIIFLLLYLTYLNRRLVAPLKKITRHASGFVEDSSITGTMERIRTGDEIETLSDAMIQMEHDIREYTENLATATAAKEHMAAELNVAKQIQQNLFPYHYPAFPERKDFDIYARLQSCDAIGGNFYNFLLLDDSHLCLFMGDVSGNGIPTSMFSVIATTLIGNYASLKMTPDRILANTNNELSKNNHAGLTVDAFLAIVDLSTGQFTYATAGNGIYALQKSPGSPFEPLRQKSCFPLATIGQVMYPSSRFTLSQGDVLILHSKGIAEAVNDKGMVFGASYAKDTINGLMQQEYSIKIITDRFFDTINDFENGTAQTTDSTVLIFRYMGNS